MSTTLGQFVVESILGEGSVAVVYRATHSGSGETHALKVLKTDNERVLERSLQEARVMASLQHTNVVGITDFVDLEGRCGLVMEYVEGGSLPQLLRHTRLSIDEVDHLVLGILRGVKAAHAQRLIHRDLKPANILLAVQDHTLVPKLADFGLAKVHHVDGHHGPRTFAGTTMGSPAYMAPEQFEDAGQVDSTTDLFACGAIFYEMLTGERAYPGRDPVWIYRNMLAEERPRLPDGVPMRIRRALEAAMKPNPADRPKSADALMRLWFEGSHTLRDVRFEHDVLARVLRDGRGDVDDTLTPADDRAEPPDYTLPALVAVTGLSISIGLGMVFGALAVLAAAVVLAT